MKRKLSWKVLLPIGAFFLFLGKFIFAGVIGASSNLLGTIIFIMGIIDMFRPSSVSAPTSQPWYNKKLF